MCFRYTLSFGEIGTITVFGNQTDRQKNKIFIWKHINQIDKQNLFLEIKQTDNYLLSQNNK